MIYSFAVHPRLRGELQSETISMVIQVGSSPLTRGTPSRKKLRRVERRFIPAYAGNSARGAGANRPRAVHPRLRGELLKSNGIAES